MRDENRGRAANYAAGVALWSRNVDTDAITLEERAYDAWQVSKHEKEITFEILSKNSHPADLQRLRSAFGATRSVIGFYEASAGAQPGGLIVLPTAGELSWVPTEA